MRVLIINTSERSGGAAVAAWRLVEALNNSGIKTKMLVRDKETNRIVVCGLPQTLGRYWHFLWERLCVWFHLRFSRRHLFELDIANAGTDITRMAEFVEADIIHLHWINQGMLSIAGIRKIIDSGKPVVWTMHDIWPATAICHLSMGCRKFQSQCSCCPYLPGNSDKDLAARVWKRKSALLHDRNITFVACSHWLESEARSSALLHGQPIFQIPNPIDTKVFSKKDRVAARTAQALPADRRLILFASQRVTNVNKGMGYLIEACRILVELYPEMREDTALVILGGHAEEVVDKFSLPAYTLGYVTDIRKIVDVYNSVDLFVLPSLSENLPNTIMEAMACGVPCIGFNVGGIPEEIDHKENGYVAEYKSASDLARGIRWILNDADRNYLGSNAIRKVAQNYSQYTVARRYIDIYTSLLGKED